MQVYYHAHNGTVVYITPPILPRTKKPQSPVGPPGPLCTGTAAAGTCPAKAIRPPPPPPPPLLPPGPPTPPAPAPAGMRWECHVGMGASGHGVARLKEEDLAAPPFGESVHSRFEQGRQLPKPFHESCSVLPSGRATAQSTYNYFGIPCCEQGCRRRRSRHVSRCAKSHQAVRCATGMDPTGTATRFRARCRTPTLWTPYRRPPRLIRHVCWSRREQSSQTYSHNIVESVGALGVCLCIRVLYLIYCARRIIFPLLQKGTIIWRAAQHTRPAAHCTFHIRTWNHRSATRSQTGLLIPGPGGCSLETNHSPYQNSLYLVNYRSGAVNRRGTSVGALAVGGDRRGHGSRGTGATSLPQSALAVTQDNTSTAGTVVCMRSLRI